jgi:hypothetical protein
MDLEGELLRAAHELSLRRGELAQRIVAATGVEPYDYWIRQRGRAHIDRDGEWSWCARDVGLDVLHADGRRAWLEYTGDRTASAFSCAGLRCFVEHARPPWGEFWRLAHPLVVDRLQPLVDSLVTVGFLAHASHGYVVTAQAVADLQREPAILV